MLRRGSNHRKTTRNTNGSNRGSTHASSRKASPNGATSPFALYVEGPRDREILSCWARRIDHGLARTIEKHAFILGGRQPARALADFRKRGGAEKGLTGLVVLDRDDHGSEAEDIDRQAIDAEEGLEAFVWGRRHIESYLLVPATLRRLVGLESDDRRIERFVEQTAHAHAHGNGADSLHAKRVLGAGGSLAEIIGTDLRAGEIAKAMRRDEFHEDVVTLLDRISDAAGHSSRGPEVVRVRSGG